MTLRSGKIRSRMKRTTASNIARHTSQYIALDNPARRSHRVPAGVLTHRAETRSPEGWLRPARIPREPTQSLESNQVSEGNSKTRLRFKRAVYPSDAVFIPFWLLLTK